MVKSLQCQSDILYLIENWLSDSEENIFQLIDSNSKIFFESDFSSHKYKKS